MINKHRMAAGKALPFSALIALATLGVASLGMTTGASAQEAEIAPASDSTVVVFNTLLFMLSGMVVMFMAAGFCMLEAGLVRAKNAATICLKNITLYSVAGLAVWFLG